MSRLFVFSILYPTFWVGYAKKSSLNTFLFLQKWVPVMCGWWTWLFSLLSLFVTSFCISEENEIYIWNEIAPINESNDGKWLAVFQSSLPNVKQVNASYEHETCKKFHVGLETTVFCFYPTRTPQVLGRSPAPSCGLSSPNRPIVVKESVLWKNMEQSKWTFTQMTNSCFQLCPIKRN